MSVRALAVGSAPVTARSLRTNAGLALGADAAAKVGALATMVVAARLLPAHQFAVFGTALAAVTVLTAVVDGGAATLIVRDGAASSPRSGGLLAATALARLPLVALVLAGALGAGIVLGRTAEALLVALLAIAGAATLSVLALFRAAQDLAFEARQRLLAGCLAPPAVAAALTARPTAAAGLVALLAAFAAALAPLALRSRRAVRGTPRPPTLAALAGAAPFALMALATIAYYRSGTFFLAASHLSVETGRFVVASSIGFGLLALPNAITTGLLPQLAGEEDAGVRCETARRTLAWTARLCVPLCATVVLAGGPVAALVFGERYHTAGAPLGLLGVSLVLVGLSGVLGTVLLVERRTGLLAAQVGVSLAVNLALCALLVPRFGAEGAAWATLGTEAVALAILAPAATRALPGLARGGRGALAVGAATALLLCAAATAGPAREVLAAGALAVALAGPAGRALGGGRS